jgi:hypothetical protein
MRELRPAVVDGFLNFPNTLVRSDGVVFSRARNWGQTVGRLRERKPTLCKATGYLRICLSFCGQRKYIMLHRLVAMVFIGPPPFHGAEVRHKDGTGMRGLTGNNAVENLGWSTAQQNADDKREHGTVLFGAKHGRARITEEVALEIIGCIKAGHGNTDIASWMGTTYDTVSKIRAGKSWKHLTSPRPDTLCAGEPSI